MSAILNAIKKYIPRSILSLRHFLYAWWGAIKYRHPSNELLVIGVTGTSGKSSVCYFLRHVLEQCGYTVGSLSTLEFYIAGEQKLNDRKMTMLGKMEIQRYLRTMVQKGCNVAIIETTSEGYLQHRHRFIAYDMMVLTNLYPEHLRAHGGFENYKKAKRGIFEYVALNRRPRKPVNIPITSIINADSEHASLFTDLPFDRTMTYAMNVDANITSSDEKGTQQGISFSVHNHAFTPAIHGIHSVSNLLSVISVCRALDITWAKIEHAINGLTSAPGRIEQIEESHQHGFRVIVDYAFEPVALQKLYEVVSTLAPKRIIHVTGNTGGGRDKPQKKAAVIAESADVVVVTNEDPYDDDPQNIIDEMSSFVLQSDHISSDDVHRILDRREGISLGISLAQKGDVVLITGKGSEQKMCLSNGRMVDWDDRDVVRDILNTL